MATGLVIHISSGEDRHTEILSDDSIRIGTSENCNLRLRASSLPKSAATAVLLELSRTNGSYRVTDFDSAVPLTLNGAAVSSGNEINDGDELRIDDSELLLHFFPVRALPAVVPGSPRERTSRRLSKPRRSSPRPPPDAMMPKSSCASLRASSCARSTSAPRSLFSGSSSRSWAACSTSASRCTRNSSAAAG